MNTFTTEDRIIAEKDGSFTANIEPIPFAGLVTLEYPERLLEQGSDEWRLAKLGHVSGSNIGVVMQKGRGDAPSKTRQSFIEKIVAERYSKKLDDNGYTNEYMEWGTQTEPQARQAYEVSRETFVDKTGFWKHPSIAWVGCSPDGLVGKDGLIEIKCPKTSTHLSYIWNNEVPSAYYLQMQCQMWVTNREWCDFVSFDPRVPEKSRLFVKRCHRSNDTIADMELAVKVFLAEVETRLKILSGEK